MSALFTICLFPFALIGLGLYIGLLCAGFWIVIKLARRVWKWF